MDAWSVDGARGARSPEREKIAWLHHRFEAAADHDDERDRPAHVYEACLPAEQTKRQIAGDMLQRVFEGSASQLMLHALAGRKASREEIGELRRLLDEYERNRQ